MTLLKVAGEAGLMSSYEARAKMGFAATPGGEVLASPPGLQMLILLARGRSR